MHLGRPAETVSCMRINFDVLMLYRKTRWLAEDAVRSVEPAPVRARTYSRDNHRRSTTKAVMRRNFACITLVKHTRRTTQISARCQFERSRYRRSSDTSAARCRRWSQFADVLHPRSVSPCRAPNVQNTRTKHNLVPAERPQGTRTTPKAPIEALRAPSGS